MADAESNIIINVDTSIGISEIKNLQRQISELNAQLLKSGAQQAKAAQNIQRNLISNINATGKFAANVRTISSTAESFTTALEGNKLSMGQYFKYAGGATKSFGRLFKTEFNTIEKVATERVKTLQTQYIKLGRDANGALKAIAVRPLSLDMQNLSTQTAMAAQKQQLFNQLLKQGSTNLLNFGKNTQWAGRQLMVGFTIPLAIMGSMAVKEFEKIEKQAIRFKRVYGDAFSSSGETEKALEDMRNMAREFTKYGIAVEKTLELAADAAQMGLSGAALSAQVTQATRLAVLGEVEQQEALQTTVSVMNAFGIAAEDLASKIDFLNAVENETVTAISDLTIAIPKAGPVVKQLGGNVEDLAFFLTAMKEGGINASEGANALKSGLASIINPAQKTKDMLNGLGISIDSIVEGNAGDIKGTVIGVATALDQLDPLNRARAIEQLFGKFQFSRISTLFQNVIKEGTQAQRVLQLTKSSSEELAILSERELGKVEDSPLFKFQKAVEGLQDALAPIGKEFLKAITPVIEFGKTLLDRFNSMSDGAKSFAIVATTVVAGIGPILLMTFGLVANGIANLIKMFAAISSGMRGAGATSNDLALSTEYMTQQQLEAAAVAASLDQAHSKLIQTFSAEAGAVDRLATSYGRAIVAQSSLLNINPETGLPVPVLSRGGRRGPKPKGYNKGIVSVPGPKGAGDIVPAMLSPGEAVIPAKQSQKYAGLISGMVNDDIPGYRFGLNPFAAMLKNSRVTTRMKSQTLQDMLKKGDTQYRSAFETGTGDDYINRITGQPKLKQQYTRMDMERTIMGIPRDAPASARPTYGSVELTPMGRLMSRLFGTSGKQFRNIAKPGNEHLDIYGDTELVGKRSLNKRSSIFSGDMLRAFNNSSSYNRNRYLMGPERSTESMLPPMRGTSKEQLEQQFRLFRHPFGKNIPGEKSPSGGQYFTSNPGFPYTEAQVAGGFNLKEISKIRVPSRAEARQIQKLVDQAGLKIRVTPQNAPMAIKALSNIFGTRFEEGTRGAEAKPRRYSFSQDRVLQSSHFAPEAPIPEGQKVLTRKQMQAHVEKELAKGVRIGAFSRAESNVIKKRVFEQIASKNFAGGGKLLSSQVGLTIADFNQKVRMGTPQPANQINSWLKKQPLGMLGGSSLLATRAGVRGDFSDDLVRSYSQDLESSISRRLGPLGNKKLDESGMHKIFKAAQVEAENKIKDLKAKEKVKIANRAASLQINPAIPGTGGPGATRKFALNNAQEAAQKARPKLANIFEYRDNFLSKNSVMLPSAARGLLNDKFIGGLSPKQRDHLETALSKVNTDKFKNPSRDAQFLKITETFKDNPNSTAGQLAKAAKEVLTTQPSSSKKPAVRPSSPKRPAAKTPAATQTKAFSLSRILGAGGRAGAVAGLLGMLGLGASVMGSLQQNQYAKGVVSVPGPKGKGDVVPAMLSPGEAVIPAKESRKYAPLIQQMIHGKIPGYSESNVPNQLPLDPSGNPQPQPAINQKAASTIGTNIGKILSKSKALTGALVTSTSGIAKAAKDMARSNAEEIALKKMGPGLGGAVTLADGRVFDQISGKSYMDQESYQRAQDAVKNQRVSGSTYATKTGQVFKFDETGNAKRVLKSQQALDGKKPSRFAGLGGKAAAATSMAGMVAMGYGMSGGPGAEVASQAAMPLMMAPMLAPLLKMLANPYVAAGVALAGIAATVILLNNQFKETAKKAYDLEMATGASAKTLIGLSEFAGNVSAGEAMDRRRDAGFDVFQVAAGKTGFGSNFLESESGKSMFEGFSKLYNEQGSQAAGQNLTNQMATAVASGALEAGQARDIVAAIGKEIGDYAFSINVNSKLLNLLGPNGENLLENPLGVRLSIVKESQKEVAKFADVFSKNTVTGLAKNLGQGGLVASAAVAGAAMGAGFGFAVAGPVGAIIGGLALGAGAGLATYFATKDDFEMSAENIGGFAASSAIALQTQQEMLDSLQVEYEQRIANANAQGDAAEASRLEAEYLKSRNTLLLENANTIKSIQDSFAESGLQPQILSQFKTMTEELYKDDVLQKGVLGGLEKDLSALDDEKEIIIRAALLSGDMLPSTIQSMLSGEDSEKNIDLFVKLGAAGITRAKNIEALFGEDSDAGKRFTDNLLKLDPGAAEKEMDKFNPVIQTLSASGTDALAVGMEFFLDNPEKLDEVSGDVDKFKDKIGKDPITLEIIQEVYGQEMVDKIAKNQEYFDKLPDDQKVIYTTVLRVLGEMDASAKAAAAISFAGSGKGAEEFKKATGMTIADSKQIFRGSSAEFATDKAIEIQDTFKAEQLTEIIAAGEVVTGGTPGGPGTGEKKDPFLNVLSRLKEIRDAAIKAAGGMDELKRALADGSVATTKFVGIEQQLLFAGYGQEFISSIRGMDEETRKDFISINNGVVKVTAAGKLMNKAFSEITLGDFQFSIASGVAAVNNQTGAMTKLVDAGMTVADAYEIVQNEALAYAIATSTGTKEVEDLVDWLEKLRKKQEELKLSTPEGIQDWLQDYQGALSGATSKVAEYFAAERAVADEDFFSGTNATGRNKELFNIDKIMEDIDESTRQLDSFRYELGNLDYDLSSIASQEDLINKKYDERLEALDKVLDANSDISEQQKSQLDIVTALSSGDIAAAARAVQESRARETDRQAENKKAAIERQRESELQGLRSTGGKTRKQLEDEILDLTNKINKEQAESLVPSERRLTLAQQARDVALEAIGEEGYLGKTEKGWAAIENAARLAVVQSDAFRLSLVNILRSIPGISFDVDGNVSFDPKAFGDGIKTGTGAKQPAPATTPITTPPPTKTSVFQAKGVTVLDRDTAARAAIAAVKTGAATDPLAFANQVKNQVLANRSLAKNENTSAADKARLTRENIKLMNSTGLKFGVGGMVPHYKRLGGLIPYKRMGGLIPYKANGGLFQSINTDTVPAMLTPGEFVIRRHSVQKYGTDKLSSINNGTYNGESVYNYSVNVNVKSDSNPDQIAKAVMTQIKQVDSMRLRGNKF